MRRCEDEKMFYRPPLLEEPCAQTLSGKSHELCEKIVRERLHNKHHLRLCNEIYLHQSCKRRHAHLEQPSESSMMSQEELNDFREGSLQSTFDMCRVGKLRLPRKEDFLRKRTSVNTTSGYMDFHLHQKYCKHAHAHEVIQGSMKHEGQDTIFFKSDLRGNPHDHETLHKRNIDHQRGRFLHDAMVVDRVFVGSKFSQDLCNRFNTVVGSTVNQWWPTTRRSRAKGNQYPL